MQILEIALKYCLPNLANQAETYLQNEITFQTVFPILVEADRLSANGVRDNAISFILSHWGVLARYFLEADQDLIPL